MQHMRDTPARGRSAYPARVAGPLLIADVPWLLYRSFFALPKSIKGAEGKPVNALLGTVNAILAVIEARPARSPVRGVVACMGAEQADYRVALYEPYHAHRPPMPPELRDQWQRAPALLASFGWTVAASDDLEADDLMLSYAQVEAKAGGSALLLTADRDLYGAVGERIAVVELLKGGRHGEIDAKGVRERYGVDPGQVPDFIALRGDPSDGLPGAPGIGAKGAAELLREHGTLEALLAAAEALGPGTQAPAGSALRPRTVATLRDNAELLRAFKQIATLQRVKVTRPRQRKAVTDHAGGAAAAEELGMRRLAERLRGLAATSG
jgi:5'-3' exonuclease